MERQGTCLGNFLRKRKNVEVKLTFHKHRKGMLKPKEKRMEHP
jgi:hypothetical protein